MHWTVERSVQISKEKEQIVTCEEMTKVKHMVKEKGNGMTL